MSLRDQITVDLKAAIRAEDSVRLTTLRLIAAAIRDRDLALRSEGSDRQMPDDQILTLLTRMIQLRQETVRAYEEGGRLELAEQELAEIAVIEGYLPRQMDDDEVVAAIDAIIAELGAATVRDMGRVMAMLKVRFAGQMDVSQAGRLIRSRLGGGDQP